MKIISLTLASIGIILAYPQPSTSQHVLAMKLASLYSSTTESECHVLLKLCPIGKAEIVQTCRPEDGFRTDRQVTTPATWTFDELRVVVQYGCVKDVFAYTLHDSERKLCTGHGGVALRQVEPVNARSRLAGYGDLWREPPATHWTIHPGGDFLRPSSASGR